MNYDCLQKQNWEAQQLRVELLRQKIASRNAIGNGRVVPSNDDLAIGEGRRLNMAVMFIDISGFSSRMMESAEEQDVMLRVLNLFFSEMIKIAEEYGGNVEKHTGDGLLIYFNDSEGTPAETGTKRAVACALTMFAANDQLINPILINSRVQPINFRASIDHGPVTIARIGAARRFNANVAIGTTANIAAKMLRHAAPGQLVIGELARDQLPESWKTQFTAEHPASTGWHYRSTGFPYRLYIYLGRWQIPL